MSSLTEKNTPPPLTTTEKALSINNRNGNECLAPTHTTESVIVDDNNNSNGGNNSATVVGVNISVAPAIKTGSDDNAEKLKKLLSELGVSSVEQSSSEEYNRVKEDEPRAYAGSRGRGGGGGAAAGKVTAAKSADSGYESKRSPFTEEEDEAILEGYKEHGNKWSEIQRGDPALAKRIANHIRQRYINHLSPEAQEKKKAKEEEKKKKKTNNNSKKKRSSKKNDDELFEVDDDDELEVEEEEEKNNNKKKRKKNKSSSRKKKNDDDGDDDDVYVPPDTAGGRGDRARKRRLKDKENRHNRNLMIEEMM
jgi:hypothetical protein